MNGCAGEDVRDDDIRRALGTLLKEGALWLAILWLDPPPDWELQTLRHHERALGELREVFADCGLDAHTYTAALSWLTGYCMSMRARHDGASATDVLRRSRERDPAERADRRAPPA